MAWEGPVSLDHYMATEWLGLESGVAKLGVLGVGGLEALLISRPCTGSHTVQGVLRFWSLFALHTS